MAREADSRRVHAVDRVVGPARTKAEERLQRFLDAALELTQGPAGMDFSVHDVVERSGQSLRSFYAYFDGKHELLLALLDSSAVSVAAELAETVAEVDDPLERLHRFCVDFYALCRTAPQGVSGERATVTTLGQFALQLFMAYPREAMRAFGSLNALAESLLHDAIDAGSIRTEVAVPRIAATLMEAVMFDHFALVIEAADTSFPESAAEELWQVLLHGLGPLPVAARRPAGKGRR